MERRARTRGSDAGTGRRSSRLGEDIRVLEFPPGEPVSFATGPGDLSWSISVTAADPSDLVGIRQVTDPSGDTRYLAEQAPVDDHSMAYRQPDGSIDGFAVAAPGTPVLGPASHACVAVSAGEDPAARGSIALHEILHQAGLTRHTTELCRGVAAAPQVVAARERPRGGRRPRRSRT